MRQAAWNGWSGTVVAVGMLCLLLGLTLIQVGSKPAARPEDEADLLAWLEERSMLYQAREAARTVSGHSLQWRHRYGQPQPREAVRHASVWLLDYPGSVIPQAGKSVIATWADRRLWDSLRQVGIELLHTGPINRAGGIRAKKYTPTIDGWFDRIALDLDPALGTEEEYRNLVRVAEDRGALLAGDLVPLHTGFGPDFHLALRGYKDYPGMYTLVEVAKEHWDLLPPLQDPWEVALVPRPVTEKLARLGYIPGPINSCDAHEEARTWSGWSASGPVRGVDGRVRRWVFLHYFKPAQPTLNWLDPSFAAQRAIAGDVVRTVQHRRTRIVRLDAVPFLGIEKKPGSRETLHYQHPLSVSGTNYVAMLTRKLGGWTFHELNVPLESLKNFTRDGSDLSYDFVTRAQCLHALLSGDAGPLRLAFRWLLQASVQPVTMVHDLQNHDEITFQLVEPEHRKDESFVVSGKKRTGKELRETMLQAMRTRVAGAAAPYNKLYRPEKDGVATTFAGFIAPALGIDDPYAATPEQIARIRRGHLLLAAANALQPGVFSLSSWDLVGALPIPASSVRERTEGGDYRWINRGGVDLLGANPDAHTSAFGLQRARALYGALPEQLKDPESFASRLAHLLAARKKVGLDLGELLTVPEPRSAALCLLGVRLPDGRLALTVLNFGRKSVEEDVDLRDLARTAKVPLEEHEWTDLLSGKGMKRDEEGRLRVQLEPLSGTTLVQKVAPRR